MEIPKIGSIVQITTRYPESYIFSDKKYKEFVTSGKIVPNDRWTPTGSFQMSTGRKEYPVAVIAIRNVVKIKTPNKTIVASIKKTAPRSWKVKSSKGNETYTVTDNQGSWFCNCVGFQYHRRCKHIVAKKGK